MKTPLIILAILLAPTFLAALIGMATRRPTLYRTGGLLAYATAFIYFAVGHVVMTDDMAAMLPAIVPARHLVIYATGLLEVALAVGLVIPHFRKLTGWMCIAVLVLFFPANIYAALNSVGPGGHQMGPIYLLIRGPLQLLLVFWGYWFVVRSAPRQIRAK